MYSQIGCNGVDNGALWFDHVRVPREALLNISSEVAADGTFTSKVCGVEQINHSGSIYCSGVPPVDAGSVTRVLGIKKVAEIKAY